MKFVRWKRYGFTHIVDENPSFKGRKWLRGFAGGFTVCGNWWHNTSFRDEYQMGLLPPSKQDNGKRPLCGNCKKYLEKNAK